MRKLPYCSSGIQQQVLTQAFILVSKYKSKQENASNTYENNTFYHSNIAPHAHKETMLKHRVLAVFAEKLSQSEWNIKIRTSMLCGTPGYMAPEFLLGEMGPKCDVFSFGVVRAGGKVCTYTPDHSFDCMYICRSSLKHTAS